MLPGGDAPSDKIPGEAIEEEELDTLDQKYNKVLVEAGGCGKFQIFTVAVIMCGLLSSSWYIYALTYYELMPPGGFQCLNATTNVTYGCEPY